MLFCPIAVEVVPSAELAHPLAKEDSPLAFVLLPNAVERVPMLSLSHWLPKAMPALNAALSAYHIILLPPPSTGGLPGVIGNTAEAENNTLLSVTCSLALGVVVPMPTLPVCEKPHSIWQQRIIRTRSFFMLIRFIVKLQNRTGRNLP